MIPFHVKEKYTFLRAMYVKAISINATRIANKIVTVSFFSKNDIAKIAKLMLPK
jgi:hypothetical protein